MARKKSSKKSPSSPVVPAHPLTPPNVINDLDFDAMEDRIRGEEIMMHQENQKLREQEKVKKALTEKEIDSRLEELRNRLGTPKKKKL
jgi:hypothetical protein